MSNSSSTTDPSSLQVSISFNSSSSSSSDLNEDESDIDISFVHAVIASLSVIIISEIGDKSFFITAIMAMSHSRLTVFMGAVVALGFMTVLSALLGFATSATPNSFTQYLSSGLLLMFGLKMLKTASNMTGNEGLVEYEEVEVELRRKEEEELQRMNLVCDQDGDICCFLFQRSMCSFLRVFVKSFILTFLAEWGDRSQISTIILGARGDILGVILGGIFGHVFCSGLAVTGGRFVAQKVSLRTVHIVGGIVFLVFAISAFFIGVEDH